MNTEASSVQTKELHTSGETRWVKSPLVRARWRLFVAFCLVIAAFELLEPIAISNRVLHESVDVLLLCVLFLGAWLLMETLLRTIVAKSQAVDLLQIKHNLSLKLALAPDWNSLVELILDFCRTQIDLDGVVLLLNNPRSGRFEVVASSPDRNRAGAGEHIDEPGHVSGSCTHETEEWHRIEVSSETPEASMSGYCLPLVLGDRAVAKLHFYLPEGSVPRPEQVEILNGCASDIAIALTSARLSQEHAELLIKQARSDQRRHISMDLHDTLGQKLVYLRLKLDHFSRSDGKTQLADIQGDLVQMEAVANESYELVRGTLAVLNSGKSPSLYKLLMGHSRLAVDRTQLNFTFDEIGRPQTLAFDTLQQLFYIFGEALNNIERHAAARNVDVTLIWDQEGLTIRVTDDGRGFDTAAGKQDGHYGLTNMRERAQAMGGQVEHQSGAGRGTCLTIRLPLGDNPSGQPLRSFAKLVAP